MTSGPSPPQPIAQRTGDRHPIVASALIYSAVFAVFGSFTPYFPLWLTARGLSGPELSIVMSAPMFLRLAVTPFIGRMADRQPDRRWLMAGLLLCSLVCAVLLAGLNSFWSILPVSCLMLVAFQPVPPLVDATVNVLVRRGRVRDFGRLRLCGSVSFAVVAVLAGLLLEVADIDRVFALYVVFVAVAVGAAFLLPSVGPLEPRAQARPFNLLREPALLVVFLAVGLINSSQAMYLGFGTMHMLATGFPGWSVGPLWTISVVAEVVVLWYAPAALERIGAYRLLMAAALSTLVRWCGMAFDPPLVMAALLQILHAGTLSCTYLALMAFIQRFVKDEEAARAQSAMVTITGIFMAAMTLAMGPIYEKFGGLGYGVVAVLPALAAMLLFAFRRRLAD